MSFYAAQARLGDGAAVAAQRRSPGWNLAVGNQAEYIGGLRVSAGFFDVLGIQRKPSAELRVSPLALNLLGYQAIGP